MVEPITVNTSTLYSSSAGETLSVKRPDTNGRIVQGASTKEIGRTLIEQPRDDRGIAGTQLLENLDSVSAKFVRARAQS